MNKKKVLLLSLLTFTLFVVLKTALRDWTVIDIEEIPFTTTLPTSSEQWRYNGTHRSTNITTTPAAAAATTDKQNPLAESVRKLTVIKDSLQMTDHFPKVFIIGFAKTGTKALYEALKLHPQLSGPMKELRYFTEHYTDDIQDYLNMFTPPPTNGYNIEKSPDYILSIEAARRLKDALAKVDVRPESVKLVVVLRNPVVRTVSDYLEMRNWALINGRRNKFVTTDSFDDLILRDTGEINSHLKIVNSSCYSYHIYQWTRLFGKRDQFCFVNGDRFVSDPFSEMKLLEQCLRLQPLYKQSNFFYNELKGFYCFRGFGVAPQSICMAKTKGRKHPTVNREVVAKLKEYFRPWNYDLYHLVDNYDFGWENSEQY